MILGFWKGTTLCEFCIEGGINQVRKLAIEMIMLGIKNGFSKEQQILDYREQLDTIENLICKYSFMKDTDKIVETIAEKLNCEENYLQSLWIVNIMALLIMKVIKDDNNFGFVVME